MTTVEADGVMLGVEHFGGAAASPKCSTPSMTPSASTVVITPPPSRRRRRTSGTSGPSDTS